MDVTFALVRRHAIIRILRAPLHKNGGHFTVMTTGKLLLHECILKIYLDAEAENPSRPFQ